jgi:hypothetical protein
VKDAGFRLQDHSGGDRLQHLDVEIHRAVAVSRPQRAVDGAAGGRVQDRGGKTAMPPPMGLRCCLPARAWKTANPFSTRTRAICMVAAIEGGGSLPSIILCSISNPLSSLKSICTPFRRSFDFENSACLAFGKMSYSTCKSLIMPFAR